MFQYQHFSSIVLRTNNLCLPAGRENELTFYTNVSQSGEERFRMARITIDSLIRRVSALPGVQKNHLALFGHSHGAGAALDYLVTHQGKVQAVILNSCGYPPEVTKRAVEVNVPVLILHGTADNPAHGGSSFTNIEMARQFEAALRTVNKEVEVKYYEGGRHNGIFSDSTQFNDTVQRICAFLRNILFK